MTLNDLKNFDIITTRDTRQWFVYENVFINIYDSTQILLRSNFNFSMQHTSWQSNDIMKVERMKDYISVKDVNVFMYNYLEKEAAIIYKTVYQRDKSTKLTMQQIADKFRVPRDISLDIYIISPTLVKKKSTGIWISADGQNRELTYEEAIEHFPNVDPDVIQEIEIETNEFWHGNIKHNLMEMADACWPDSESLYSLLWSKENPNNIVYYIQQLFACLTELQNNPETYKQFNSSNVWGAYEQLVKFVRSFIHALIDMPEGSEIKYFK